MGDLLELLKKSLGISQDTSMNTDASLLSDNRTAKTLNLMGLLSSPELITGLGLISQGTQGKPIGEAILPAVKEGITISSSAKAFTKEQEQQKAIDEFADKVPEQYKPLFKAFPKETMKLLLTPKTPTISGTALKIAEKFEGLNEEQFKDAFSKLPKVEKDIYNKEILGNQDIVSQLLSLSGGKLGDFAQPSKQGTSPKAAPLDIKSTDIFKKYKEANPTVSDDELIEAIRKKFPNK